MATETILLEEPYGFNYTAGKNIFSINFPKHLLQNLNYFWLNKDNLSTK